MKKATLKEQKELVKHIRQFINKNGDAYQDIDFDFDYEQRRDCLNWINFKGFVNDLEQSNQKRKCLDIRHINTLRDVTEKYLKKYYSSDFRNSHTLRS